jgi:hypothetical protein
MNTDELDAVEARVIEDLHRRDWIIEKESHKEYGRVLAAAMKHHFSSILENLYLNRLDEASEVAPGSKGWVALGSILVPVKQDVEMFKWVIGTDDSPIGLDDAGHLYVSNDRALEILRNDRDALRGRLSSAYGIIAFLALVLVALVAARCAQ